MSNVSGWAYGVPDALSAAAVCLASNAVPKAIVSALLVIGVLTRGDERTRPSRMIARFLTMASPDALPSVLVSASLNSRMIECADPWSVERVTDVGVTVPSNFPSS